MNKESYYLKEHLMVKISPVLAEEDNRKKVIEFTGKLISDHSTQLSASGPVDVLISGDKITPFLYELFNITGEELSQILNNMMVVAYEGDVKFNIIRSLPYRLLIIAMIIEGLNKGYSDIVGCGEYMAIFTEYPLTFRRFWPKNVRIKEDVMKYTIEHLSDRFIIKRQGNLLGLLRHISHSAVNFHKDRLKREIDSEYVDFTNRLRNQLRASLRSIAEVYYNNLEKDATISFSVSPSKFPRQGEDLNLKIEVILYTTDTECKSDKYEDATSMHGTSKLLNGIVVRQDDEAPFNFIIKLDDGRFIINEEIGLYRISNETNMAWKAPHRNLF